jgi:hypothetical protein
MKLLSVSSHFFAVGFSMGTEGFNQDSCSTCVPLCASTYTRIFILSLIVGDLGFPSLFIFHPLAVKFVLDCNKIWSL